MNNYDKMKELIQENKLQEALLLAFSNSLQLKIMTKSKANQEDAIETIINLLRGVSNRVSNPDLINNSEKQNSEEIDIFNFHEQQKKIAYELWNKNRETIVRILQIIAGNPIEISSPRKGEKHVVSITKKQEQNLENFEEEFEFEEKFEQNEIDNSFEVEENPLEEDNWVNGIVDDIVGEAEEEIIYQEEDSQEESWDDFVMEEEDNQMEEESNEAEVIINAEEENWDELIDSNYSEDSIVNSNGTSPDNVSKEEEWQEWLEESPEEFICNDEHREIETDSANLEVGDEWQEWLEDDNTTGDNIKTEEDMEEIDWGEEDWEEEKVN